MRAVFCGVDVRGGFAGGGGEQQLYLCGSGDYGGDVSDCAERTHYTDGNGRDGIDDCRTGDIGQIG